MKKYILQFKPFLFFICKFLGSYAVFIFIYNAYLKSFDATINQPDDFTVLVARQSEYILSFFDFELKSAPSPSDPSVMFYVSNKPFVRIVEGCNAMSVMILFIAFVLAFSGRIWQTAFFMLSGVMIIHILNIVRIALLTMGLYFYPQWKTILHDIVFPLFIYGVVFGLWVVWVNKFSYYAKKI